MMTEKFDNVNHLVLNFYPDGYSIAVKLNEFPVFTSETILETAKISYEETSLLDYIENEELPPLLVEMIDGSPKLSQYKIWHNGCLILEIRDKINVTRDDENEGVANKNDVRFCRNTNNAAKQCTNQKYDMNSSRLDAQWILNNNSLRGYDEDGVESSQNKMENNSYFILLKPTNLSMLNDVLNLTESNTWSTQDRLQLESQIVLHNSPPLFLEPDATEQPPSDPSTFGFDTTVDSACTRHKKKLPHTKLMNRNSTKSNSNHSSVKYNSSKNSPNQTTADTLPPELTLQQFLATKRTKKKIFSAGHLARFNRYRKNLSSNI